MGKYWGWYYEKNGNGLTFIILDDEYFVIFFVRILRVKGYYDLMMCQRAQKCEISINFGKFVLKCGMNTIFWCNFDLKVNFIRVLPWIIIYIVVQNVVIFSFCGTYLKSMLVVCKIWARQSLIRLWLAKCRVQLITWSKRAQILKFLKI